MRVVKAITLAKQLGIPRRTMSDLCKRDPKLAFKKGREWWIRLDQLSGRPGISLLDTFTIPTSRWIKATNLARMSGFPVRTVIHWCKTRPHFAKRIGRNWYIDLEQLGASEELADAFFGADQANPPGKGV